MTKTEVDMVMITSTEYNRLLEAKRMLSCLEAAGVDNWDGYYYATREFYGEEDEEEF